MDSDLDAGFSSAAESVEASDKDWSDKVITTENFCPEDQLASWNSVDGLVCKAAKN